MHRSLQPFAPTRTIARDIVLALIAAGGVTLDPRTLESPTAGYVVSMTGAELRLDPGMAARPGTLTGTLLAMIESWLDHVALPLIAAGEYTGAPRYVGAWVDSTTGHTYLDVSEVFDNPTAAVNAARNRKQLAVWNIAGAAEIRLS